MGNVTKAEGLKFAFRYLCGSIEEIKKKNGEHFGFCGPGMPGVDCSPRGCLCRSRMIRRMSRIRNNIETDRADTRTVSEIVTQTKSVLVSFEYCLHSVLDADNEETNQ